MCFNLNKMFCRFVFEISIFLRRAIVVEIETLWSQIKCSQLKVRHLVIRRENALLFSRVRKISHCVIKMFDTNLVRMRFDWIKRSRSSRARNDSGKLIFCPSHDHTKIMHITILFCCFRSDAEPSKKNKHSPFGCRLNGTAQRLLQLDHSARLLLAQLPRVLHVKLHQLGQCCELLA